MLFACLFAPRFVAQSVARTQTGGLRYADRLPIAVLDGPESTMRVIDCNDAATAMGVDPGISKAQAEQFPGMTLVERSWEHEAWAQDALLECASSFSPKFESTERGAVTLDVTGLDRLFGPPKNVAEAIMRCTTAVSLKIHLAMATNPDAALIAAKGIAGITVIPSGKEREYLAPLSLEALSPTPEQMEILESWGIRTCGSLGELPAVPLSERLGQDGLRLKMLASGKAERTLRAFEAPLQFEESLELEDAVELLDSLLFVVNRLLDQLLTKLSVYSLFVSELHCELALEKNPGRDIRQMPKKEEFEIFYRIIKLPVPMQDKKMLLNLIQLDLQAHPPSAAIKKIRIWATPAKPRLTQGNLFIRSAPQPERAELLEAKLRAIVGPEDNSGRSTVGTPRIVDSPRPDAFTVLPFTDGGRKRKAKIASQREENLLRIFRPPKEARIVLKEGRPAHLSFAGISSEVEKLSGPWKYSGSWWQGQFRREIWDVQLKAAEGISCFRIYRDLENNAWFVSGKFD